MKKNFISFLLMSIGSYSCHDSREIMLDGVTTYRKYDLWRQDFKDRVFCNCILKGIEVKFVNDTIHNLDRSFNNEIEIVFKKDIQEILNPVIAKMKRDSLESLTTVAEGVAGKHVFDTCIDYYKSRQLDSISKAELKKWKKMNIDSTRNSLFKKQK